VVCLITVATWGQDTRLGVDLSASELVQQAEFLRGAKRDLPGAVTALETALAKSPPMDVQMQARLLLASVQLELGKNEAARVALEALIAQKPMIIADDDLREFSFGLKHIELHPSQPRHIVTVRDVGYRFEEA
jgi:hypothetical protein